MNKMTMTHDVLNHMEAIDFTYSITSFKQCKVLYTLRHLLVLYYTFNCQMNFPCWIISNNNCYFIIHNFLDANIDLKLPFSCT